MRALLVYNPNATTTSPAVVDVIARALSSEVKLEVEATKRRDHAGFLAAGAVHEGFELVVALGGDGTVNEVIQGLARSDVKLGVLPGGSTNVWARTLGLPNDAVEATSLLLRRLREGDERTVSLGTANGRWFAFNAGFGFDAAVVQAVEQRARMKRRVRQATFLWCGARALLGGFDRKAADISVVVDGTVAAEGLRSAVCCNSDPWTYLGPWPARLCPRADLELGLDLTGISALGLAPVLRLVRATCFTSKVDALGFTRLWHDERSYELRNPVPLPLQVDGDHIGDVRSVELRSHPAALTVVA